MRLGSSRQMNELSPEYRQKAMGMFYLLATMLAALTGPISPSATKNHVSCYDNIRVTRDPAKD